MDSNRLSTHREEKPIPKGIFTKLKEPILMKNTPSGSRTDCIFLTAADVFFDLFMVMERDFWHLLWSFTDGCADPRVAHMYYCGTADMLQPHPGDIRDHPRDRQKKRKTSLVGYLSFSLLLGRKCASVLRNGIFEQILN